MAQPMTERYGKPVLNIVTGFLHIYPCRSINPQKKRLANWIMFDTIDNAKEYAKMVGLKIKPCVYCAMEAYYVKNR